VRANPGDRSIPACEITHILEADGVAMTRVCFDRITVFARAGNPKYPYRRLATRIGNEKKRRCEFSLDGNPFRGSSMASHVIWTVSLFFCLSWLSSEAADHRTHVSIVRGQWHINGRVTYPGTKAEGLLMNVRMVNSVFEDRNRDDFDAEANTNRFLARMPDYVAHGVLAFTICLQGGMPGYEGALNSAFEANGSLREDYLRRVASVIESCDRQGVIVILGCFYQRQDQVLHDEAAVRRGLLNAVNWIVEQGWQNVVLEVANEFDHGGFDHSVIRSVAGQLELIRLVRQTAPGLLVSTSGLGHGRYPDELAEAVDFLLIHFNGTKVRDIPDRIAALRKHGKPIVCNEDDKQGHTAAQAAELCVANGASWGLMLSALNQYIPLEFHGSQDDPIVYRKLRQITSP